MITGGAFSRLCCAGDGEADSLGSWESLDAQQPLPVFLTVPVILVYMLLCALAVSALDSREEGRPALCLWDAFYYVFFSISTIGLGDVLPNDIHYSPLCSLMFLFGLALLSVVNSTVYTSLQQRFRSAMDSLEDWLETLHAYRHGREGYNVFKSLGPNLQVGAAGTVPPLPLPVAARPRPAALRQRGPDRGAAGAAEHRPGQAPLQKSAAEPVALAHRGGHRPVPAHARRVQHGGGRATRSAGQHVRGGAARRPATGATPQRQVHLFGESVMFVQMQLSTG